MNVYEIIKSKDIYNVAGISGLSNGIDIYQKESVYGTLTAGMHEIIGDYIGGSCPAISGEMRTILLQFAPDLYTKRIHAAYAKNIRQKKSYWFCQPKRINALHEKTIPNIYGDVKHPVLKEKEVRYAPVISVIGLDCRRWFVSLAVAECLIRHHIIGLDLKEMEVFE